LKNYLCGLFGAYASSLGRIFLWELSMMNILWINKLWEFLRGKRMQAAGRTRRTALFGALVLAQKPSATARNDNFS